MIQVGIFNVRIVRKGDRYGSKDAVVHEHDEPMVEFYDARQTAFGPRGQFVSRYYVDTFMSRSNDHALDLQGGVDDWFLTHFEVRHVKQHLREELQGDSHGMVI